MKNSKSFHSELLNEAKKRAEHITSLKRTIIMNKITVLTIALVYLLPSLLYFLLKVDMMVAVYCGAGIATLGILALIYLLFTNSKPSEKLIFDEFMIIVAEKIKDISNMKNMDVYLSFLKKFEKAL